MSFANTLRLLLHRKVSRRGESLIEREMRPTYYPDGGFAEIAEKMSGAVEKSGGRVHLDSEVVAIEKAPGGGMRLSYRSGGETKEIESDLVVSTMPLPLLMSMLTPPPPADVRQAAASLDYRALVVLGMVTTRQDVLDCGYTYLLNRPYNRIFEMNAFSPRTSPPGENIIGVEIPCLKDSAAWKAPKEELFDMCIGSLAEDGFLAPGDVSRLLLVKAPYAYPIYRKDYAVHLEKAMAHIAGIGPLSTLGRSGEFMYMDIDRCIERSFDAADRLVRGHRG